MLTELNEYDQLYLRS